LVISPDGILNDLHAQAVQQVNAVQIKGAGKKQDSFLIAIFGYLPICVHLRSSAANEEMGDILLNWYLSEE